MRDIIRALPDQIEYALEHAPYRLSPATKRFRKVLVCGMGGSGISGNLLQALYPSLDMTVNKDYTIPQFIDRETLAVIISYSGNTEETLSNYQQLAKRKIERVVITSGGRLMKQSKRNKILVPGGLPPRGALGHLFTPLPFILHHYRLAKNPAKELSMLVRFLKDQTRTIEIRAKKLARTFVNKLPIIYAPSLLHFVIAQRWQCQFNENAKTVAHTNIIPEMNHNEIVGLGKPLLLNPHTVLVFLDDPAAHPRNRRRMKIVKEIVRGMFSRIIEIKPRGANILQRTFWTIMLGDLVSYHLAVLTNIDPMPVKRIDYLKKQLSKK